MKVLIPSHIHLDVNLGGVETASYDVRTTLPDEHRDADVLVVWQNEPTALMDAARRCTSLKLVQSLAAGIDAVEAAGFPAHVPIASGTSLHDQTVTEHALTLVLACVRRLDLLHDAQIRGEWDTEVNQAQQAISTAPHFTLANAKITILGFGSIARYLAPVLESLGAEVVGVARHAREDAGFKVLARDDIDARLSETELLISLLPHTVETESIVNSDFISRLAAGAAFVNVGRGRTVDEEALMQALRSGRLRCAAIDVTRQEPLPADSPLWSTPNLIITPHVAGNRPVGASALVRLNVNAVLQGGDLVNLVASN